MLARWPIRYKLLIGTAMLALIVALLSLSGFRGVYAYRHLARSISHRAAELPKTGALARHVDGMRLIVSQSRDLPRLNDHIAFDSMLRERFRDHLNGAMENFKAYKELMLSLDPSDDRIGDGAKERETMQKIEETLLRLSLADANDEEWILSRQIHMEMLAPDVERLHELTSELLNCMYTRMRDLQGDVRIEYRTWIVIAWLSTIAALLLLVSMGLFFNACVFRPLRILINGSRRVANGDFAFRIRLNSSDEMAELANAMNAMTIRFLEIRDDLNRQVRERTKEVVRSEQLASVGFLAAGVAHEINNPLASILWSAEGIESRLQELYGDAPEFGADSDPGAAEQLAVVRRYLRRIQEEAVRCKGITEGLLDFSRLGHIERQPTDLGAIVEGVVDMVQHLGKYRDKTIECRCEPQVTAFANPQEMKQVVLNLLTNALDSVDVRGRVEVDLRRDGDQALLVVSDNGCGMTDEVKEHLFEPFFTRRRDGQGTGLGLSITYRIVQDHGGRITAHSEGPGKGAEFRLTLPLVPHETHAERRFQAA